MISNPSGTPQEEAASNNKNFLENEFNQRYHPVNDSKLRDWNLIPLQGSVANIAIKYYSEDSIVWEIDRELNITNNFKEVENFVKHDVLEKPSNLSFSLFFARTVFPNLELTEKDVFSATCIERLIYSNLSQDKSVFTFLVCDEIQSLNPDELNLLKRFTKSRNLATSNVMSIWTGSTQSQLLKVMAQVPSNGFSCYDDNLMYTIPTALKDTSLKDTIMFVNLCQHNLVLQEKENCNLIYASLGVLHFSYVLQIGYLMGICKLDIQKALNHLMYSIYEI